MELFNLLHKKKVAGFRLIEVWNGKETIVCEMYYESPFAFRPRKDRDYIAEAIYQIEKLKFKEA